MWGGISVLDRHQFAARAHARRSGPVDRAAVLELGLDSALRRERRRIHALRRAATEV